jgi:hypothetical protein
MRPLLLCLLLLLGVSAAGVSGPDAGAADAGPPRGCPGSSRALPDGAACPLEATRCEYSDASCICQWSTCVTPAGPIPGCVPKASWQCRFDGCPLGRLPSGRCWTEGKVCGDDDGMCSSTATCQDGKWTHAQPLCRPAAMPHR